MNDLNSYMKTRRSSLSLTLDEPGPDLSQVREIVEIASRVPDHGKLAPWRFVLWDEKARKTMHAELSLLLESKKNLPDPAKKQQGTDKLLHAPCVLAVISTAREHAKVPMWEQELSVGAACMNTLIAANSLGFEAQWLTAWYVYDDDARSTLGLSDGERLAGIVHIGTSHTAKSERPRPEVDDILSVRTA